MMTIIEDVAGKVTALLKKYEFDASTLARYLGLSLEQVNDFAHGKMECLLEQRKVLDKIMFLYAVTCEDADLKASAFLEVLVSCHHLSTTAVAKMQVPMWGILKKCCLVFRRKLTSMRSIRSLSRQWHCDSF